MKCAGDDRQTAARGIWTRINPRNRRENILAKDALLALGRVHRRPERAADDGFRFDLFCGSRAPGENLSALHAPLRERQQFCGQNASYRANYPNARFEIVEHDGAPIGRIVTARTPASRSSPPGAGAGSAPVS
jgi:hypothetical protein